MTDEQINAAIAEACGWTDVHFSLAATDEWSTERRVVGMPPKHCTHDVAPNYCTDLNAIHEAEKTLTREQVREYQCHMYDMACEIAVTQGRWMPYSATARYRAEAFLKALGKWEEVQA